MKTSNKILGLVLGATISFSAFSAASGSGVRGGGHVIEVDSAPVLMDLVTKAVCDWKTGDEFISELPSLRETLKNIERLDWYFARDLEDEIKALNYCITGNLYRVEAFEKDTVVTKAKDEYLQQAGYRQNENVFIDGQIFYRMKKESSRSMLIVHEVMHSYLPMATTDRALKLRSIVKTLDKVRSGEIKRREELHFNMRMNQITFPLTVATLTPKKGQIEFFKGNFDLRSSVLAKTTNLDSLINFTTKESSALASWDAYNFGSEYSRKAIIESTLVSMMQLSSGEEITALLKGKDFSKINLAKVVMSEFKTFSPEQQNAILETPEFKSLFEAGFDEIIDQKLELKNALITAPKSFTSFVNGSGVETEIVSLEKAASLPASLSWLADAIVILNDNNALKVITENEKFYRALGLKAQKEQVQSMHVSIAREKKVATARLEIVSQALVESLLSEIRNKVEQKVFNEIKNQINKNKF